MRDGGQWRRRHTPLEQAVPGAEDEPVAGLGAHADTADDAGELGLHLRDGLARVRERVEVRLQHGGLAVERRLRALVEHGRVRARHVVRVVHDRVVCAACGGGLCEQIVQGLHGK
jgi:hypothetical protein